MPDARALARPRVVLLAVVAALGAPLQGTAAADPDPPPPDLAPFPLPMDSGFAWVQQRTEAVETFRIVEPVVRQRRAHRAKLQVKWDDLSRRIAGLDAVSRRAARELEAARDRVRAVAVRAYMSAGSAPMGEALGAMADASDIVQLGRQMHLMDTYGQEQRDAISDFEAKKKAADDKIEQLTEVRNRLRADIEKADRELQDAENALAVVRDSFEEAAAGIARFHKAATSAASPILGPSRLSPRQLADFVTGTGHHPKLTVPLTSLAKMFLQEGEKVGVRGDVAFAQSILETGWFRYPGKGSLVDPADNNFAGVGACDSCAHGFRFESARIGVRAQVQLLRIYTDDSVELNTFAPDEIVLPGTLRLGFRGKVQSWWDLTGTWATADTYGTRVYALYDAMVEYARTHPTPPRRTAPG